MNSQETSSESEVGPSINDIIKQHQKKDRVLICKTCILAIWFETVSGDSGHLHSVLGPKVLEEDED